MAEPLLVSHDGVRRNKDREERGDVGLGLFMFVLGEWS